MWQNGQKQNMQAKRRKKDKQKIRKFDFSSAGWDSEDMVVIIANITTCELLKVRLCKINISSKIVANEK